MEHYPAHRLESRRQAVDHAVAAWRTAHPEVAVSASRLTTSTDHLITKSLAAVAGDPSPAALLLAAAGAPVVLGPVLAAFAASDGVAPEIGQHYYDLAITVCPVAAAIQLVRDDVTDLAVDMLPEAADSLRSRVISPLTDRVVADLVPTLGYGLETSAYVASLRGSGLLAPAAESAVAAWVRADRTREARLAAAGPGVGVTAVDAAFTEHYADLARSARRRGDDVDDLHDAYLKLRGAADQHPSRPYPVAYVRRSAAHAAADRVGGERTSTPVAEWDVMDSGSDTDLRAAQARERLRLLLVAAIRLAEPAAAGVLVRVFCPTGLGARAPRLTDAVLDLGSERQVRAALREAAAEAGCNAREATRVASRAVAALQAATGSGPAAQAEDRRSR